jgi:Domain of unknown function (DUF397)
MDLSQAEWRKAARSNVNGGNCVEVAELPGAVAVRDSKHVDEPKLIFAPHEWHAFTASVKAGDYDLP